jgi:beta,beta-carotene 9',10'-dioxygenase
LFGKTVSLDVPDGFVVKQIPTLGRKDGKTHGFDKLAKIWIFSIKNGHVCAQSFFLPSKAYEYYCKTGRISVSGFNESDEKGKVNQNVNVFALTSTIKKPETEVIAVTETPPQIYLNGSIVNWQDELPKKYTWESAHPLNRHGVTYNYLIEFSWPNSHYVFYKIEGKTRKVVAKIATPRPSYMHSFGETENYLLLMETPLRMQKSYPSGKIGYIKNFTWEPNYQSKLFIVNKKTGKISTINTPPLYFYHSVNAYEDSDQKIVFDVLGQAEGAPLITGKVTANNMYFRYVVDLRKDKLEQVQLLCDESLDVEFPVINEAYATNHRYVYMVACSENSIVKYDAQEQKIIAKTDIKNLGEPIFVRKTDSKMEDDGYLFTICVDPAQLVIFDARTLKVVKKVKLKGPIDNIGLHGRFFPKTVS